MSISEGITVVDVFRELEIEPKKRMTWRVGFVMQEKYREEFGEEPPKANRPKTKGTGSHCFAIYPRSYRPRIIKAIREAEKGFLDATEC